MSGKMLGCGNIVQVPGLPGSPGFDGAAVQMRIDSGFIQWKLADSADWIPLIALSDLTGPAGDSGTPGATGAPGTAAKNIDLQTNATHIQWRYIGEPWQDLVTLASLVGPQGPIGNTGVGIASIVQTGGTGAPGTVTTYTITYTDASTATFGVYQGADGADGVTISPIHFTATKALATTAAASLPDDTIIEVAADESLSGARTRYTVAAGALVFAYGVVTKADLADASDPAKGAALVGYCGGGTVKDALDGLSTYAAVRRTTDSATRYSVVGLRIAGEFLPDASDTASGAWFTGAISGTTLTVATKTNGTISVGNAINRSDTGETVGYITALGTGTGGVGTYTLSNAATVAPMVMSADNGGTLIVRTGDGLRLKRKYFGPPTLFMFGAEPGGTIVGSIIQAAIDSISSAGGGVLLIPENAEFYIDSPITNKTGVTVRGEGWSSVIKTTAANIKMFDQDNGESHQNVHFENFRLVSGASSYSTGTNHCINFLDTGRITSPSAPARIHDMWLEGCDGDGIYIRSGYIDIRNIHCKNTYRQGIAVTKGDHITINGVRGEGSMIALVDIEPNSGDIINYLSISDVKHYSSVVLALQFYVNNAWIAPDLINHVHVNNIETASGIGFGSITDLTGGNIKITSSENYDSLSFYLVKKAALSNIVVSGGSTTKKKINVTSCENIIVNSVALEGGANIDTDFLSNTNIKFSDVVLTGVGNIGARIRQSSGIELKDWLIQDASSYAVYMDGATVANSRTRLTGLTVVNSSVGVFLLNANGDTYIDGNLTGATTKVAIGAGYTGKLYYGELIGFSPLVGSTTYDPPSLTDGAGVTTTVSVPGAVVGGGYVDVLFGKALQGILVTGWVSGTNVVSVRFQNETGGVIDLASDTLTVYVRQTYP